MAGLVVDDQHKQEKETASSEKDVNGGGFPKENGAELGGKVKEDPGLNSGSPKMKEAAAAMTQSPKKGVGFLEKVGGGVLSFVGLGGSKPAAGAEDAASPSTEKQAGEEEISKAGGVRSLVGSKHADESPESSVDPIAAQEPEAAEIAETRKRDVKTPKYMDDTETDSTDTSEPLKAADVSEIGQAEEETPKSQYGTGTDEPKAAQVTSKAEDPGTDTSERTPIPEEHEPSKPSSYLGGVLNRVGKWTGLDSQAEESRQAAEQEVPPSHVAEANEPAVRAEEAASPPAEQELPPSHIAEANEPAARAEEAASQPAESPALGEHVSQSGGQKVGQGVLSLLGLGGSKPASGAEKPAVEEQNSNNSADTEKVREGAEIKEDDVKSPKSVDATHIDDSTDTREPRKAVDVAALDQATEETPKFQDATGTDESKTAQGGDSGTNASERTPIPEEHEPSKPNSYFGSVLNRVGKWTGRDSQPESGQAAEEEVPHSHIAEANESTARAEEVASPPAEKPALEEDVSQSVGVEKGGQGVLSFLGLGGSKAASRAEKAAVEERNSTDSADTEKVGEGDVERPKSLDATETDDSTDTPESPKAVDVTESEQATRETPKAVNPELEANEETPKSQDATGTDESNTAQAASNAENPGTGFSVLSLLGLGGFKPASGAEKPAVEERNSSKSADTEKVGEGDVKSPKSVDATETDDSTDTSEPPKAVDVTKSEQAGEETLKAVNPVLEAEEETPKSLYGTGTDDSKRAQATSIAEDPGTGFSVLSLLGLGGSKPASGPEKPAVEERDSNKSADTEKVREGVEIKQDDVKSSKSFDPTHIDDSTDTREPPKALDVTESEQAAEETPKAVNSELVAEEETPKSLYGTGTDDSKTAQATSNAEDPGTGFSVLSLLGLGGSKPASGAEKPAVEEQDSNKSADTEKVREDAEIKQDDVKSPKSFDPTHIDVPTDTREPPKALDVTESEQAGEENPKAVNSELVAEEETPKSLYGTGTDESKTAQAPSIAEDPGRGFSVLSLLGLGGSKPASGAEKPAVEERDSNKSADTEKVREGVDIKQDDVKSSKSFDPTPIDDSTDTRERPKALDVTESEQAAEETPKAVNSELVAAEETPKAVNSELVAEEETPKSLYGTGTDESKTAQATSIAEDPGTEFSVLSSLGLGGSKPASGAEKPAVEERDSSKSADTEKVRDGVEIKQDDVKSPKSFDPAHIDDSSDTREPPKALDVTESEQAAEEIPKAVNSELVAEEETPKSLYGTGTDESKTAHATSNAEDPGTGFRVQSLLGVGVSKPASGAEKPAVEERDFNKSADTEKFREGTEINQDDVKSPKSVDPTHTDGSTDTHEPPKALDFAALEQAMKETLKPVNAELEETEEETPKSQDATGTDESKTAQVTSKGVDSGTDASERTHIAEEHEPSKQSSYFGSVLNRVGKWTGRDSQPESAQGAEQEVAPSHIAEAKEPAARAEEVVSPPAEKPALEEDASQSVGVEKVGQGVLSFFGLGGSKSASGAEKPAVEERNSSKSADTEKVGDGLEMKQGDVKREPPKALDFAALEQAIKETLESINAEKKQTEEETPKSQDATGTDESKTVQATSNAEDPGTSASEVAPIPEDDESSKPSSYFGAMLHHVDKGTGLDPKVEESSQGGEREMPVSDITQPDEAPKTGKIDETEQAKDLPKAVDVEIGDTDEPKTSLVSKDEDFSTIPNESEKGEETPAPPSSTVVEEEEPDPSKQSSYFGGILNRVGRWTGLDSHAQQSTHAAEREFPPSPTADASKPAARAEEARSPAGQPALEEEGSKSAATEKVGEGVLSLVGLGASKPATATEKPVVEDDGSKSNDPEEGDVKAPKSLDATEADDSTDSREPRRATDVTKLEQAAEETPKPVSTELEQTKEETPKSVNSELEQVEEETPTPVSAELVQAGEETPESVKAGLEQAEKETPKSGNAESEQAEKETSKSLAATDTDESKGARVTSKVEDPETNASARALILEEHMPSTPSSYFGSRVLSLAGLGGSPAPGAEKPAVEKEDSKPGGVEKVGDGILSLVGFGDSKHGDDTQKSPVDLNAANGPKAELKEYDANDPKSMDGIETDDSPNAHELKPGEGAELEQSEDQIPKFRADAGRDESAPATSKEVGPPTNASKRPEEAVCPPENKPAVANDTSDAGVIDKVGKDVLSAVSPTDSKSPESAEELPSSPAHQPAAENEVSKAGGVEKVGVGVLSAIGLGGLLGGSNSADGAEEGASPPAEEPAVEKEVSSNKSVGIEKVGEGVLSAVGLGGPKATGGANEAASSPVEEAPSPPAEEPAVEKEVPNKAVGIGKVREGVLSAVGLGGSKATGGANEAASSPVEEAPSPPAEEPIVEKEVSHSGGIEKVGEGVLSTAGLGDSQPGAEAEEPAVEKEVPKSVGVEKVGEGVLSTVGLGDSKSPAEAEEISGRPAKETSSPPISDVEKEDSSSRGVEKVGAGVLSSLGLGSSKGADLIGKEEDSSSNAKERVSTLDETEASKKVEVNEEGQAAPPSAAVEEYGDETSKPSFFQGVVNRGKNLTGLDPQAENSRQGARPGEPASPPMKEAAGENEVPRSVGVEKVGEGVLSAVGLGGSKRAAKGEEVTSPHAEKPVEGDVSKSGVEKVGEGVLSLVGVGGSKEPEVTSKAGDSSADASERPSNVKEREEPKKVEKNEVNPALPLSSAVEEDRDEPSPPSSYFGGLLNRLEKWTGRNSRAEDSSQGAEGQTPPSHTTEIDERTARPEEKPVVEEGASKSVGMEKVGEGVLSSVGLGGSKQSPGAQEETSPAAKKPDEDVSKSGGVEKVGEGVLSSVGLGGSKQSPGKQSPAARKPDEDVSKSGVTEKVGKGVLASVGLGDSKQSPAARKPDEDVSKSGVTEKVGKGVLSSVGLGDSKQSPGAKEETSLAAKKPDEDVSKSGIEKVGEGFLSLVGLGGSKKSPGAEEEGSPAARKPDVEDVSKSGAVEKVGAGVLSAVGLEGSKPAAGAEEASSPAAKIPAAENESSKPRGLEKVGESVLSSVGLGGSKPADKAEEAALPPTQKPALENEASKSGGIEKVGEGVLSAVGLGGSKPVGGAEEGASAPSEKPPVEQEVSKTGGIEKVGEGVLSSVGLEGSKAEEDRPVSEKQPSPSVNIPRQGQEAGATKVSTPTIPRGSEDSIPTTPRGTPLMQRVEQLEQKLAQLEGKQSPVSEISSTRHSTLRSTSLDRPFRHSMRYILEETGSKGSLRDRVAALEQKLAYLTLHHPSPVHNESTPPISPVVEELGTEATSGPAGVQTQHSSVPAEEGEKKPGKVTSEETLKAAEDPVKLKTEEKAPEVVAQREAAAPGSKKGKFKPRIGKFTACFNKWCCTHKKIGETV